jgi:hypothetical protein
MSDSIASLLGQRNFEQPPEIEAIKAYVADQFAGRTVSIKLHEDSVIVTASSAAFVGALKPHIPQLQKLAGDQKRIVLRVG